MIITHEFEVIITRSLEEPMNPHIMFRNKATRAFVPEDSYDYLRLLTYYTDYHD
jgi:hypothetical protein